MVTSTKTTPRATSVREHHPRQQKFNQIGEIGRITGIEPPKNVPRDSIGNELPNEFFDAASSSTTTTTSASLSTTTIASKSALNNLNNTGGNSFATMNMSHFSTTTNTTDPADETENDVAPFTGGGTLSTTTTPKGGRGSTPLANNLSVDKSTLGHIARQALSANRENVIPRGGRGGERHMEGEQNEDDEGDENEQGEGDTSMIDHGEEDPVAEGDDDQEDYNNDNNDNNDNNEDENEENNESNLLNSTTTPANPNRKSSNNKGTSDRMRDAMVPVLTEAALAARKKAASSNRPDHYAELGERGRKTGLSKPIGRVDEDGFETISNFFGSSSRATGKSNKVIHHNTMDGDEEDDEDMESPTRQSPSHEGNKKRKLHSSMSSGLNNGYDQQQIPLSEMDYGQQDFPEQDENDLPADYNDNEDEDEDDDDDEGIVSAELMSARRNAQSNARKSHVGGGDSTMDMEVDDGSSLTPGAFKRLNKHSRMSNGSRASIASNGTTRRLSHHRGDSPDLSTTEKMNALNKRRKSRIYDDEGDGEGEEGEEEDDDEDREEGDEQHAEELSRSSAKQRSVRSNAPSLAASNHAHRRSSVGSTLSSYSAVSKGKGKAVLEGSDDHEEQFGDEYDEEHHNEDDYLGQEQQEEDEELQESNSRRASMASDQRKAKAMEAAQKRKAAATAAAARKAENLKRVREMSSGEEDGVRRSHRQRLQPLEYWRNERVVYKRRASGIGIKAVVRIPKPDPDVHSHRNRKPGSTAGRRGGGGRVKSEVPPEEGVDDMTDPDGLVHSWEGRAETRRRIAFTAKMIEPKPTFNNKFLFQKIFTELDYMAGGILQIPAGAGKPTKPSKDNSYMFYCIEGSVSVVVHRTRFTIGPGGTFFVPRGNQYSITATSNRDVKLFFTQARRVFETEDGNTWPDVLDNSQDLRLSQQELDANEEGEEEEED